jgi:ribose/xylose/arabinose/galactoside ABC-type transport system permease subunit
LFQIIFKREASKVKKKKNFTSNNSGNSKKIKINNNIVLLIIFVLLFTSFSIFSKGFLTYYNITTMLRNLVVTGILAIGLTPLMISRGIDISFGSSISLAGVVMAMMYNNGVNLFVSMLVVVAITTLIGLINGMLIETFELNALIATLGTQSIFQALALVFTAGYPIGIMSDTFYNLSFNSFLKLPIPVWFFIIILVIYYFILNFTIAGRTIYLIGANPLAAFACGINYKKVRIVLYTFFGLMVGFAAIFTAGFSGSGSPYSGTYMLLPALSAVLLGGIGLQGGSGTVWGTALGVLITSVISNGLIVASVSPALIQVLQGVILIIIVASYEVRSRKKYA